MGSSFAAETAGYIPKKIPTSIDKPKLTPTDQKLTIGVHSAILLNICEPTKPSSTPPNPLTVCTIHHPYP